MCQRCRLIALLSLALFWIAASLPALALDFDAHHSQAVAANPPGVTFSLKLAGGKTQYHQGEIIPLQAVFTSSQPWHLPTQHRSRQSQPLSGCMISFVTDRTR